jgi:hypothetical protein
MWLKLICASSEKGKVNIFRLDGSGHEHSISTGLLDNGPASEEKWEAFRSRFANSEDRFGEVEIANIVKHFMSKTNPVHLAMERSKKPAAEIAFDGDNEDDNNLMRQSKIGTASDTLLVFTALLAAWGRIDEGVDNKYFTSEDLRGLVLEGRYPKGWQFRLWGDSTTTESLTNILSKVWCHLCFMCLTCCHCFRCRIMAMQRWGKQKSDNKINPSEARDGSKWG